MMKVLIVLLVALFALVSCNPSISDDFTADVQIFEERGSHILRFDGTLYEDYTNKRQRIDTTTTHEHNHKIEFLRLYNAKLEYENDNNQTCRHRALNGTMRPAFDWLKNAKQNSTCTSHRNETGNLWVYQDKTNTLSACVDQKNQNQPLYVEDHDPQRKEGRRVNFNSFISGTPPVSAFTVPSFCK